jgi:alkanesulfonate monooxygenase SsuD/methylene tetrahydromethanopterin reductase-like flavin-dependent oxidoreductase (luciferase family)
MVDYKKMMDELAAERDKQEPESPKWSYLEQAYRVVRIAWQGENDDWQEIEAKEKAAKPKPKPKPKPQQPSLPGLDDGE